jgi:maleate cis-trans isomerase
VRRTLTDLADAGADALALCFVSGSVFGGPRFDEGFAASVRSLTGVEAFTAGRALRGRLAALGPRRCLLLAPPWFTDATVAATEADRPGRPA